MSLPVLYSFRRCPYAIRARIALHKAGVICEHREVSLKHKPEQMLALSSKGTVPVLLLPDSTVMEESFEIMVWALRQHDPNGWLQVDMNRVMQLVRQNDDDFKPMLDRYKYHVRYPQFPQSHYRQQCEVFLGVLESHLLSQHAQGLLADRISIVDMAIFPFIRQFAGVDRERFDNLEYQHLVKWLRLLESDADFNAVMHKHPLWQPG